METLLSGIIVAKEGTYRIHYNEGREQPYTVWHIDKAVYFAKTLEEAMAAVSRDNGGWLVKRIRVKI